MIRLLVMVIALIAAILGGLIGLIHFGILKDFTGMIAPPELESDAAPPPQTVLSADPAFVQMDAMRIPYVSGGRVTRSVYISFRLEAAPGKQSLVYRYRGHLRDIYLRGLQDHVAEQFEERRTIDVLRLKAYMLSITQTALGPDMVQDIVIDTVFEQ